ncbi:site-2 protease family protein [Actinomyces sp. B33]|uniref:M50 family metallopeptidase n=1 Tax=Actinomyces sp. B33 TaxID=2942131 RepID=UPI002341FE7F|nr:site-2 protease family protein [Actinomyces sp. B33]MDC4232970.1 site-2 protease family protein [Actinomyces sp. B33]
MGALWGVVVIVVGLLVSVGLHEVGHMIPAKRFGALVPEYSVGFGPALASRRVGRTRYVLRAILLGGYVRILGMYGPARPGTRTTTRGGRPTLAEEARLACAEELPAGAEHRAFYRLSAGRKVVVMAAGPVMNLLICVVLTATTILGIGVPAASLTVDEVAAEVSARPGPAAAAGVEAGDEIVSWNGEPVADWASFQEAVASSGAGPSVLVVDRRGERLSFDVTPVDTGRGSLIGVTSRSVYAPGSVGDVARATWGMFTGTAAVVVRLPMAVWDVVESLATGAPRDPSGVVSVVGVGRLAGEVTAGESGLGAGDARQRAALLLSLLASLNMALFVFNLIPLPPLDGGHIAGALYEAARRSWARVRGRPDPGHADTARLVPLTWAVGGLLMAMSALLIVADIVKPISLG